MFFAKLTESDKVHKRTKQLPLEILLVSVFCSSPSDEVDKKIKSKQFLLKCGDLSCGYLTGLASCKFLESS